MQLIGMLDSPYVRRVAIMLRLMELDFTHRAISVFRNFDEFRAINPAVKAPSLICDNGVVLMDSTLILEYARALAAPEKRRYPTVAGELQRELRLLGLALAACEKSVQYVYERNLRPPEKRHGPWLERVRGQMLGAYQALEAELKATPLSAESAGLSLAGVTAAVSWNFARTELPELATPAAAPTLAAFTDAAEAAPEFLAFPPVGPGVPAPGT